MSTFVGISPFSNPLWAAIETMHFHIVHTKMFLRTTSFRIQGVPMNNLTHRKNCPQIARLPKLDAGVPLTKIWIRAWLAVKIEPRHQISNNVVCASSKGSDQPAQSVQSLC